MAAQTLFEKIWESHVVRAEPDGTTLPIKVERDSSTPSAIEVSKGGV